MTKVDDNYLYEYEDEDRTRMEYLSIASGCTWMIIGLLILVAGIIALILLVNFK